MLKGVPKLFFPKSKYSLLLLLAGTLVWSLTMVKSGLIYSFGMGFWGPNGHDGVWHIALIKSLANGSWEMPIFAGETIRNYHFGFDLLLAFIYKITFIPVHTLYFQIIPPILAYLIGSFAYSFVLRWTRSQLQAFWSTFFIYFGGSWGWVVTLLRDGGVGGDSMFWSQQSMSTLVNPPFALSLLIIFLGLNLLIYKRVNSRVKLFVVTFLFGLLAQIKVYAAILILGGLFAAGLYQVLKRKGTSIIKLFAGSLIVSVLVFVPLSSSGNPLVFQPFWFIENMFTSPDRFYWPRMGEAIINYKLAGNWPKLILAYTGGYLVLLYGNLGPRVLKEIAIWRWIRNYRKLSYIKVLILTVIILGILIPLFFIQKGTPWNTIQFMYYTLVFCGLLAGSVVGRWLERVNSVGKKTLAVILLVLLTLPSVAGTLKHYLPARPPAMISNQELEALNFLSLEPPGTVLTRPFDRQKAALAEANPPRPLYLYESTAYVSAFTSKPVYLEDEVNLEITRYDWRTRRNTLEGLLANINGASWQEFFEKNNITYIYWVRNGSAIFDSTPGVVKAFENKEATIYRVN